MNDVVLVSSENKIYQKCVPFGSKRLDLPTMCGVLNATDAIAIFWLDSTSHKHKRIRCVPPNISSYYVTTAAAGL